MAECHARASRCSSSRRSLTRQVTRTVVRKKSRRCRSRKLPNQNGNTDKQRQKEQEMAELRCRSKKRSGSGNVKRRSRRRRKRAKRTSEQIPRGKKKRINWQRQPLRHPHRKKKGSLRAPKLPCNVVSGLAYARATVRATASDLGPHVSPDHDYCWTITDIRPPTQTV